jgi:hypothetical protein
MKCKLCQCNLEGEDEDDELGFDISTALKEGYLANKIEAASAHCDSIDYVYDEILKPWFSFSDLNNKKPTRYKIKKGMMKLCSTMTEH